MKKNGLKLLLALMLAAIVGITGCSDDSDSGGGSSLNYDVSGSGSLPSVTSDTIIKNKVVNIKDSEDVYYEYLKFTSETAGEYSVYKKVDTENTKITVSPIDGKTALPTTFTYDSATGKVTATTTSAYMFNAVKNGTEVACIAKDILTTNGENKNSLINTWSSDIVNECVFNSDGTVYLDIASSSEFAYSGAFKNDNGWISVSTTGAIPFFFGKVGANETNSLYYLAYQTERGTVEEVGKAAIVNSNVLEFASSGFLLIE